MTADQIQTLIYLLGVDRSTSMAAQAVLIDQVTPAEAARHYGIAPSVLDKAIAHILDAELRVRAAFICHTPSCWEIAVGHHDTHRAPGMIVMTIGDEIRLLCAQVGVMVRVRVTELPEKANGYYRGVILGLERSSVRFQTGDGVMFSDDQAVLPSGVRRPRRPIPL